MNDSVVFKNHGIVYFKKKEIPRKSEVMRRLGGKKNTFAGNMISRVYDYYFDGALNLKKEYRRYYRKEFANIEVFIEEHFNIEHEEAIELANEDYSIKYCTARSIERNIETLNYDEAFKKAFSDAVGGLRDEDQDGIYYE